MAGGQGGTYDGPHTACGIFVTADGGQTWTPGVEGLVGSDGLITGAVDALWMDPLDPSQVLAATTYDGLFRSTDGGRSWRSVDPGRSIVKFASLGGTLYAATSTGVIASTDVGASWTVAQATTSGVATVVAVNGVVFAGTDDGTLYRGSGASWTRVGQAPGGIHQIAVDPATPEVVFVVSQEPNTGNTSPPNLYSSHDGGATWGAAIDWNPKHNATQALAFSAVVPHRLYVASDFTTSWTDDGVAFALAAMAYDVRELYLMPNAQGTDDRCLVASDQGIAVADTCSVAGSTVTGLGAGLSTNLIHDFAVTPDGKTVLAVVQDAVGVVTIDGGQTWSRTPGIFEVAHVAIDPADPQNCYAINTIGMNVMRSVDGCHRFAQAATLKGPQTTSTGNVFAFDPSAPGDVYVIAQTPAGVYRSSGGGAFDAVAWPFAHPTLVAFAPHDGHHVIVGDGATLHVSRDGGTTWQTATGLPQHGVAAAAISPSSDDRVLVAWLDAGVVTVYRSQDGGATFVPMGASWSLPAGTPASGGVVAIEYSSDGRWVAATSGNGVFVSADDGDHWSRLDTGTTSHWFTAAHWVDGRLYVATFGQGILRTTEALP